MANTPILEIPFPDEDKEDFYDDFVSMMRELERITLMNKIQSSLIIGGGGTVTFNPTTGMLSWTADFTVPIIHYGKKITIQNGPNFLTRQALLSDGSILYVEIPYTMNKNLTTHFLVTNQFDRLNHQQAMLGIRIGSKVYFKGMAPV